MVGVTLARRERDNPSHLGRFAPGKCLVLADRWRGRDPCRWEFRLTLAAFEPSALSCQCI